MTTFIVETDATKIKLENENLCAKLIFGAAVGTLPKSRVIVRAVVADKS